MAAPGERVELEIAILPGEARELESTGETAVAELMEGVEPKGTWTLEVFAD